jgi:hypothetical protein
MGSDAAATRLFTACWWRALPNFATVRASALNTRDDED